MKWLMQLFSRRQRPAEPYAVINGKVYPGVSQAWADAVVKLHQEQTDRRFMC